MFTQYSTAHDNFRKQPY